MAEQNGDSPQTAIAWMILAGLCFSATGVFVKLSGGLLIVWTVIFGRSIVIAAMTFVLAKIQEKSLSFEEPKWLLARCITGLSAMACYFYAIPLIPLTTAVVLQWTSPLFVALFSGYLIKERVSKSLEAFSLSDSESLLFLDDIANPFSSLTVSTLIISIGRLFSITKFFIRVNC